ncbi:ABC transporter ATP-binding protein [Nocardia puris]|uniref:Putative ABC transport system ATP-binding protein n=1 Tax=Nocardia puris TaxID=208602 RepID=A0A366E6D1_9NOCA|nr:ABC transporter ATP-binding protein [Nocardia puris]MBF6216089.1 ABC transporter ATP-binding protein [Nocardia puris]MBF6368892.1 ABC transporter ATP-binding protein [Nocardia puris]MBF6462473.1 ABC transporter ATP-binding protein [Nocardia puris]RBO97054.1 putative ABC transport system ATP-binding protein [Nocardia puris]
MVAATETADAIDAGRVLRLEGVSKSFHRGGELVRALAEVDFAVGPGEFVVVTGPSGAGKSTLLHVAAGLEPPDAGRVLFGDEDIAALRPNRRAAFRRRHLGFVYQSFNLVPTLSAVHNVSLPLLLDGVPARIADARATALLERVGLGDRTGHLPAELSGGQMQRVSVARALVAEPAVLLADEPTGNLDTRSSESVLTLLRDVADEQGTAVVMVTHDAAAVEYGTRQLVLVDGRAEERAAAWGLGE